MNNILFIFISYNHFYLKTTIPQCKKIYPNCNICIVNNNINFKFTDKNLKDIIKDTNNVVYLNNKENNYELGGFWLAYNTFNNYDKYIFLHNRSFILKKLPNYIFNEDYVPFWIAPVYKFSPAIEWAEKKLNEYNIELKKQIWDVCQGCSCLISKNILEKFTRKNFDKIVANNKSEAVGTETLFSYIIDVLLNVKYKYKLYKFELTEYINRRKEFEYISYIGSSQSNVIENQVYLPSIFNEDINNIFNDNINYNNNDILIKLLLYTKNNKLFENFLLKTNYKAYICPNIKVNISNILKTLRHLLFTKKYFKEFSNRQINDIINKKLIIF